MSNMPARPMIINIRKLMVYTSSGETSSCDLRDLSTFYPNYIALCPSCLARLKSSAALSLSPLFSKAMARL